MDIRCGVFKARIEHLHCTHKPPASKQVIKKKKKYSFGLWYLPESFYCAGKCNFIHVSRISISVFDHL